MYLVQLLLPLQDNEQQAFPVEYFNSVRQTLTDRFGGVTAFFRSPAVGLWKEANDNVNRADVVMFEVISSELETEWWSDYRLELQKKFRQKEVLIWATNVTKL